MNLLQYTSKEMFSSTELIRKSKMIFEKLHNEEIEKAVILRDGKPSLILMDFEKYEKIIQLYEKLPVNKDVEKKSQEKEKTTKNEKIGTSIKEDKSLIVDSINKIDNLELEKALHEIDNLTTNEDIDDFSKSLQENKKDTTTKEKSPLKEFWAEND